MKWLKRFIARLFKIQLEDLPAQNQVTQQPALNPEIKAEISQEVGNQLQALLQNTTLAALQAKLPPAGSELEESKVEPADAATLEATPIERMPTQPGKSDEFPIIEEMPLIPEGMQQAKIADMPGLIHPDRGDIEEIGTVQDLQQASLQEVILPLEEATRAQPDDAKPMLTPVDASTVRLGIDFGTTTTAVSIKVGDDIPVALPIGSNGTTRYMPSIVYFAPGDGDLMQRAVVGEEAEGFGDQARVIRSVKRCLGCTGRNCNQDGRSSHQFPWCRGDGTIQIDDSKYLEPAKVIFLIVREAIRRAITIAQERMQLDLTLENITFLPLNLGCSVRFNFAQREIIRSISEELGFTNVQIENVVEEPILAGFTFSRLVEDFDGRALIYDFGGGTFDVAVIDVDRTPEGRRVTVLTTAGDNWLGGDDIDTLVYNRLLEKAGVELGFPKDQLEDSLDVIERSRLRTMARQAKEGLSSANNFQNVLLSGRHGPITIEINRDEFEQLLQGSRLVDRSLDAVAEACQLAHAFEDARHGNLLDYSKIFNLSLSDAAARIDKVILVGGVTRIPFIRQRLEKNFPGKIISDAVIEPISAVAIGGAYQREPRHYSLTTPPYEFFIDAIDVKTDKSIRIGVFEPYEYLDFHLMWRQNARPAYIKFLELATDLKFAKLYCRQAGKPNFQAQGDLGLINCARVMFGITLDGDIFFANESGRVIDFKPYPIIHPVQEEIRKAKEARGMPVEDGTHREEWMRSMMYEN